MTSDAFQGLPREGLQFLRDLKEHNTRDWFQEHHATYKRNLLDPARLLVDDLGSILQILAPDLIADARVNRSIFRLNRDTRFHKDQPPYKTQLGLWFWEGPGKRMECSGFYLQVTPTDVLLGVGLYRFLPEQLRDWRAWVADEAEGARLREVIQSIPDRYTIDGQTLKRTPRGYDKDHPNADLLKYKGLTAMIEVPLPDCIHSEEFVPWCMEHFQAMQPIHREVCAFTRMSHEKQNS